VRAGRSGFLRARFGLSPALAITNFTVLGPCCHGPNGGRDRSERRKKIAALLVHGARWPVGHGLRMFPLAAERLADQDRILGPGVSWARLRAERQSE